MTRRSNIIKQRGAEYFIFVAEVETDRSMDRSSTVESVEILQDRTRSNKRFT
ncbi:MAG: hypothetical protein ACK55I_05390 [bacterium]